MQRPGGNHEEPRADPAAGGVDVPALGILVPPRLQQLGVEREVVVESESAGGVVDVAFQLGLLDVDATPFGVHGVRERVEV